MKQKSLLVLVCIFSLAASTQAQINKGSVWLGGNIGYSESENKFQSMNNSDIKTIAFKPAAGKAIKENLITGVTLTYAKSSSKSDPTGSYNSEKTDKTIGGGVFLRRYIPVVNRLYVFGQVDAGYYNSKSTIEEATSATTKNKTNIKGWSAAISVTPGVSYAINNKLHLETGFNSLFSTVYGKSKSTSTNPDLVGKTKLFTTGINLENASAFYIGFRFLINSKG